MNKKLIIFLIILLTAFLLFACEKKKQENETSTSSINESSSADLNIVSGSENEDLEPLIRKFEKKEGVKINIKYMGSVDIMQQLETPQNEFDAVWPANSIWIALGDEKLKRVKNAQSIMRSPVILCVKKSVAGNLGWIGKKVSVQDILKAAESGKLRLLCTSATQSNSGAMAYIADLYAFAGNPQILEMKNLKEKAVIDNIRKMLKSINRSAASSGWLSKLFVEKYDSYDAMINYECLMIQANRELTGMGREPLYAVYPVNGLAIADSPLGFIDKGNAKKSEIFGKLQAYLLSPEVQKELQKFGRRTGIVGMEVSTDKNIFNPDWGIDTEKVLSPIRMPQADVIREALMLYQTAFRKPSFTVYALDYSGSMAENDGERQLKEAMRILLDQNEAKKYMLQSSPKDITVVIPFNNEVIWEKNIAGNNVQDLAGLLGEVTGLQAEGGTDIYLPLMKAYDIFKQNYSSLKEYFPAIILMTDGRSNEDRFEQLKSYRQNLKLNWDIPVFCITFGDADKSQLDMIARYSSGQVYDGSKNLIGAFKKAKGNN